MIDAITRLQQEAKAIQEGRKIVDFVFSEQIKRIKQTFPFYLRASLAAVEAEKIKLGSVFPGVAERFAREAKEAAETSRKIFDTVDTSHFEDRQYFEEKIKEIKSLKFQKPEINITVEIHICDCENAE